MKRFTKMLALGMAVALTFGMTVSAAEEEPVNSSVHTAPTITPVSGVMWQVETTQAERDAIASKANDVAGGLLKERGLGSHLGVEVLEQFELKVDKPGDVTFEWSEDPSETEDGWMYDLEDWAHPENEYNSTWGVALVHFKENLKGTPELIMMKRDGKGKYSTTVKHGSPFAVIRWHLNLVPSLGTDIDYTGGMWVTNPYHDDAQVVSDRLYKWLGNTIANPKGYSFSNVHYGAWWTFHVWEKSDVMIDLPIIGSNEKYIMVSYPYKDGRANLNIDIPTYYVMEGTPDPSVYARETAFYTAKGVEVGNQLVMIFKVKEGVESNPTPDGGGNGAPVIAEAPVGTAPVGGVVSPKTGEMLPIAVILAAICLAGAAVCAKKARTNA